MGESVGEGVGEEALPSVLREGLGTGDEDGDTGFSPCQARLAVTLKLMKYDDSVCSHMSKLSEGFNGTSK